VTKKTDSQKQDYYLELIIDQLRSRVRTLEKEKLELEQTLLSAQEQITIDGLTEVKNRQGFNLALTHEISQLPAAYDLRKITSKSLGLLMIDADFFKHVNDRYGHEVGDQVLVTIARVLKKSVRTSDEVCRWGGEEFAIILPGINELGITEVGEKIRAAVAELIFYDHEDLRISVSIGGAVQRHQSDTALFDRADAALFSAKNNGRNRVIVADTD